MKESSINHENTDFQSAKKVLSDFLLMNGFRKTIERFIILEEIYSTDEHFNVETLYSLLKKKKYRISRATVYNTIQVLMKCGLIIKQQFGKTTALFEKKLNTLHHDHLICTECGLILEFSDQHLEQIMRKVGELMDFEIHKYSLNLFGYCKNCSSN